MKDNVLIIYINGEHYEILKSIADGIEIVCDYIKDFNVYKIKCQFGHKDYYHRYQFKMDDVGYIQNIDNLWKSWFVKMFELLTTINNK